MTDKERIEAIRAALHIGDNNEAGGTLTRAMLDMEGNGLAADEACPERLNQVAGELKQVSAIFRKSN
jgi:hypothetical protein